ncbi:MAG TPA: PDGLE domain-containing protein [Thermomicrobiales bacterium]|nr:PDGLE domain-containing protein [Thermomicrobiales bacterium]
MRARSWIALIAFGVGVALFITLFSPFASGSPDGLERVAEDKEFIDAARDPGYEIIPDYTFPGVENESLATILSGIVGVLIVAALCFGVGYGMRVLARPRPASGGEASPPARASQGSGGG